jgi:CheY-like chemotaxis protein
MLARLIGANVALASELHPEPLPVRADRTQLEQIVVNLAVNARDAMPDGGRLTLRTAAVHRDACAPGAPATWAALIVSDDGSGIDAATRERIFEPFFTTKEVGKGTGLGLATVYGIVQQNAGHIEVESEPGRGTTFRILLPLSEAQIERGRDVSPHGEADGPRPPAGPRPVVLVVEDEAGVRCLVSRALRGGGFDVIEAHDGASALAASRAYDGSIDLLLTDLVMPGASGRVVADTVSRERPGLPVLFISGYSSEALGRPDGLPHGSRLLQKPFDGTTLLREVCALLAPAGGARS